MGTSGFSRGFSVLVSVTPGKAQRLGRGPGVSYRTLHRNPRDRSLTPIDRPGDPGATSLHPPKKQRSLPGCKQAATVLGERPVAVVDVQAVARYSNLRQHLVPSAAGVVVSALLQRCSGGAGPGWRADGEAGNCRRGCLVKEKQQPSKRGPPILLKPPCCEKISFWTPPFRCLVKEKQQPSKWGGFAKENKGVFQNPASPIRLPIQSGPAKADPATTGRPAIHVRADGPPGPRSSPTGRFSNLLWTTVCLGCRRSKPRLSSRLG